MKYVGVNFRNRNTELYGKKVYVYKTNLDLELEDHVVVETYLGPTTAVVAELDPVMLKKHLAEDDREIKYVICKFDMSAVEEMKAHEAKVDFTRQKIKEVYRQKMLEQMANDLKTEFPELAEDIDVMREYGELDRLFDGTM